jgi:hypothetical protein
MSTQSDGIHTTTNPKGTGWANQSNGVVLSTHEFKSIAIDDGKMLAKRHGMQHTIHRRDGTVLQTKSYERTPI